MTREEAKKEIEKVFEPAFANYIIKALTDGATESDVEPQAFECYLNQYLFENDQMIVGKDVYEELKYEKDRLKAENERLKEAHDEVIEECEREIGCAKYHLACGEDTDECIRGREIILAIIKKKYAESV